MEHKRDYSKFAIDDLKKAYSEIDKIKFPQRALEMKKEMERRGKICEESNSDIPKKTLDFDSKFRRMKWMRRIYWIWAFFIIYLLFLNKGFLFDWKESLIILFIVYNGIAVFWTCPRCGKALGFKGYGAFKGIWPLGFRCFHCNLPLWKSVRAIKKIRKTNGY